MISIVCVYNNERILKDFLLKSLENQTSKYELILVDNTQSIYKSASGALNWGGSKANGDYIIFVHQDVDLCSDSWLEKTEKLLGTIPNLGIAGVAGARNGKTSGKIESVTNIQHGVPAISVPQAIPLQKSEKVQTVDECLVIIPRSVFDMLQFDEKVCDEMHPHLCAVDYSLSVARLELDVYVIPPSIYHMSTGIRNKNILQVALSGGFLSAGYYRTLRKLLRKHRSHTKFIYTNCGLWSTSYPLTLRRAYEVLRAMYYKTLGMLLIMLRSHSTHVSIETKNITLTNVEIEKIALAEESASCHVDFIDGRPLTQQGSPVIIDTQRKQMVTISGWAIDQKSGQAADGVFINIDSQIYIPAFYGLDRREVADHFKDNRYRFSGFWAYIAILALDKGPHILSLNVLAVNKKEYYRHRQTIFLEVR